MADIFHNPTGLSDALRREAEKLQEFSDVPRDITDTNMVERAVRSCSVHEVLGAMGDFVRRGAEYEAFHSRDTRGSRVSLELYHANVGRAVANELADKCGFQGPITRPNPGQFQRGNYRGKRR